MGERHFRRAGLFSAITFANGRAKAMTVLAATATAAMACGIVYLIFLRGNSGLERMDAAVETQITRAFDRMVVAAEALDADALFRGVAENDRGALVSGGRLFLTRTAAKDRTQEGFTRLAGLKYAIAERHVTPLSSTSALLVVTGTANAKTADGRAFSAPFIQSIVFTREGGEWRVLHAHESNPPR